MGSFDSALSIHLRHRDRILARRYRSDTGLSIPIVGFWFGKTSDDDVVIEAAIGKKNLRRFKRT